MQEAPKTPGKPPVAGSSEKVKSFGRRNHGLLRCTCSSRPGSVKCARHGYMVPNTEKLMKRLSVNGCKEILRRALTPPSRRLSLRWWNFKPVPSRLSHMSMA